MQDTPAHRPEQPLAKEQGAADDEEDDRQEDDGDRDADIGSDLGDLCADRGGFGLGQLDVRQRQTVRSVARRTELRAQARRLGRWRECARVVQGRAPSGVRADHRVSAGAEPR